MRSLRVCLLLGATLFVPRVVLGEIVIDVVGTLENQLIRDKQDENSKTQKQTRQEVAARVESIRTALGEVQTTVANWRTEFETAKRLVDSLRTKMEGDADAADDARKALATVEDRVLNEQGPDTEYGKKKAELAKLREQLDAEMHRVLNVPPHAVGETDPERARQRELTLLKPDQRVKLERDAAYSKLNASAGSASKALATLREKVLQGSPEWKGAREAFVKAQAQEKASGDDLTRAGREMNESRKRIEHGEKVLAMGTSTLQQQESLLKELGGTSKPPAAPKKKKPKGDPKP